MKQCELYDSILIGFFFICNKFSVLFDRYLERRLNFDIATFFANVPAYMSYFSKRTSLTIVPCVKFRHSQTNLYAFVLSLTIHGEKKKKGEVGVHSCEKQRKKRKKRYS